VNPSSSSKRPQTMRAYSVRPYDDITPGYHMNKKHWITLNPNGRLEASLVEDLVTESYLLVLEKLPKKQRPVDPTTFGQPSAT
jgi:predicted DNA-binding protein (MmcQ/YjbR family)